MNYTSDNMQRAMMRMNAIRPWIVLELASIGPLEEPLCGVCTVLNPLLINGVTGNCKHLTERILMFHDEWTFDVEEEDYLRASGIAGCLNYYRCLEIYEFARACLTQDLRLPKGARGIYA